MNEEEDVLPHEDPIPTHDNDPPRRSTRIAEKSTEQKPSCTQTAVQESTEAGVHLREAHAERKKTLQDIWDEEERNDPAIVENAAIAKLKQIFRTLDFGDDINQPVDQALSSIYETPQIDLSTLEFEDEPKTWAEAKASADAKRWEEGYRDELKSLKEMGVYKLIP